MTQQNVKAAQKALDKAEKAAWRALVETVRSSRDAYKEAQDA